MLSWGALLPWCVAAVPAGAATVQANLRVMDFARLEDAVTSSRYVQSGFSLETRLSNGNLQGFQLRNPGTGLLNLSGLNTVPYNGSRYIVPFTSSFAILQSVDASRFALKSIDVAEYSATPNLVTMLRVRGIKANGQTVEIIRNINRPVLGQTGDFQQITFNADWSELESVTIAASDSNFRFFNGFSLDQVVLEVVPEPSSALMAGLLGGLGCLRRQRSASCPDS